MFLCERECACVCLRVNVCKKERCLFESERGCVKESCMRVRESECACVRIRGWVGG